MPLNPQWAETQVARDSAQVDRKLRQIIVWTAALSFTIAVYLLCLSLWGGFAIRELLLILPALFGTVMLGGYALRALFVVVRGRVSQLEELARRDSLTGAYAGSYLRQRLHKERDRALETGKPAAFAYLKFIGVEYVNETYGHTVGDIVIRELAGVLMRDTPAGAVVGRFGGQDFAVLLPATPLDDAREIMEKIWDRVCGFSLDLGERGVITGMNASIGLAAYPVDADTPGEITQAAEFLTMRRDPKPGVHVSTGASR